jgi:hypothetical protein
VSCRRAHCLAEHQAHARGLCRRAPLCTPKRPPRHPAPTSSPPPSNLPGCCRAGSRVSCGGTGRLRPAWPSAATRTWASPTRLASGSSPRWGWGGHGAPSRAKEAAAGGCLPAPSPAPKQQQQQQQQQQQRREAPPPDRHSPRTPASPPPQIIKRGGDFDSWLSCKGTLEFNPQGQQVCSRAHAARTRSKGRPRPYGM